MCENVLRWGAVFKGVQFVMCVVCLVYKRVTDNEALRVFYHLEKLSREWPGLNNVTWDENGALLADVTAGGFAIVTLGLLIGRLAGELKTARTTVCFFNVLGCILFLAVGGLCLAAVDQVPHHLVDNAVILGVLAILTGLLFLIDLAVTGNTRVGDKKPAKVLKSSQISSAKAAEAAASASAPIAVEIKKLEDKTEMEHKSTTKETKEDETKPRKMVGNGLVTELRSSLKKKKIVEDLDGRGVVVGKKDRNVDFDNELALKTESERQQRSGNNDEYVQHGRRRMENRGFPRASSDDSGRFTGEQFRDEFVDAERDRWLDRAADRTDQGGGGGAGGYVPRGGGKDVSLIEGTYDTRRSRPSSMMEVELDEHYLQPRDYYIEKSVSREERYLLDRRGTDSYQERHLLDQRSATGLQERYVPDQRASSGLHERHLQDQRQERHLPDQRTSGGLHERHLQDQRQERHLPDQRSTSGMHERHLQDQRVSSGLQDQRVSSSKQDLSDDDFNNQLPSVSFLLAERGRKMLPSVRSSPLERLHEVTSTATSGKPRYYYNSARDPASGSSAPPSPQDPAEAPASTARTPGYVLHTAAHWQDQDKAPSTVSDRIHHWFRSRQADKAP